MRMVAVTAASAAIYRPSILRQALLQCRSLGFKLLAPALAAALILAGMMLLRRFRRARRIISLLRPAPANGWGRTGGSTDNPDGKNPKKKRVCVVGAGIAGCGAAMALHRSGHEVVLMERKPVIGGNAKSMAWDVEGKSVTTGVAVLAWPSQLFHSYNCLINELNVSAVVQSVDDS